MSRRPKISKLVRKQDSVRLIAALGYHDYVTDQFGRMYDLGASVRRDAALALASVPDGGDVDVGTALISALRDSSGDVRRAVVTTLSSRGDKRAVSALVAAALTWREPRYEAARAAATKALLDLDGPEAADALVQAVIRDDASPAEAAEILVRIIGLGGEETARCALAAGTAALFTDDGGVATRAAEVLVCLGPLSVDALLAGLDSEHARVPAVRALGELRDLRCGEALASLLTHRDPEVRRTAAAALGEIADPRAVGALTEATLDTNHAVRESALAALQKLAAVGMLPASTWATRATS